MKTGRFCLALAALAMVAAACGGAARAGSNSSSSAENADDQLVAFTNCMRQHGVEVESESDGEGRMRVSIGGPKPNSTAGADPDTAGQKPAPDPKVEEAIRACEPKMPKMGQDLTPEERAEMEDQMLEFAACMREHGIDMPDPGEGGFFQKNTETNDGSGLSGPDPESDEFQEAEKACEDKLPNVKREMKREEA